MCLYILNQKFESIIISLFYNSTKIIKNQSSLVKVSDWNLFQTNPIVSVSEQIRIHPT